MGFRSRVCTVVSGISKVSVTGGLLPRVARVSSRRLEPVFRLHSMIDCLMVQKAELAKYKAALGKFQKQLVASPCNDQGLSAH